MGKTDRKQRFKAGFVGWLYDREIGSEANDLGGHSRKERKGNVNCIRVALHFI